MTGSIVPRQGDMVAVVRSEGDKRDEMYLAEYPQIENTNTDVVVARVTQGAWFDDFNSLIAECDMLGVEYEITSRGSRIEVPQDSQLVGMEGRIYVADTFQEVFVDMMADMQELFASPTELAGRVLAQLSITVPMEDLGRFLGALFGVEGGVRLIDEEAERDG